MRRKPTALVSLCLLSASLVALISSGQMTTAAKVWPAVLDLSSSGRGTNVRASIDAHGSEANGPSAFSAISADGRYVVFYSWATNLVPGDTNDKVDVFVHDCETGETTRVSVASDGTEGTWDSWDPSISADGRYVAFSSGANNLVPGDYSEVDVFVHDNNTGETTRVSVTSDGTSGNDNSGRWGLAISPDGRYVAFESRASNLVTDDNNGARDIFVHDRNTQVTERVSVASDGTEGNAGSTYPSISSGGRYVAFLSEASNLVEGDGNEHQDVFVHDRQTGQTERVSLASDGTEADWYSFSPSISSDGTAVAFYSWAKNLVPDDTNDFVDVFVRDRHTDQTERVSVASDGTEGLASSWDPTITADGRYVAFDSWAPNLVPDDTNGWRDIFVHDRQTGETVRASVAWDGTQTNRESFRPAISGNGRHVAFHASASNLVPGDTNGEHDIFVRDRDARTFTVSGCASDAASSPLVGVTVSTKSGFYGTTDSAGAFTVPGLITGTYTLTPTLTAWTFTPVSRTVSVPPDAVGQDFVGSPAAYSIYLPLLVRSRG